MPDVLFIENATVDRLDDMRTTKKQRIVDMRPDLGFIPINPLADNYPGSATALNKGVDYSPNFDDAQHAYRLDPALVMYEIATQTYKGNKDLATEWRMKPRLGGADESSMEVEPVYDFNNDHFLNTISEASHGLRCVNAQTRAAVHEQNMVIGAGGRGREFGFERDTNPKKFPELNDGLPFSVEPHPATYELDRFNENVLGPVATFPSSTF